MSTEKTSKAGKPARDFRPKDKKDKKAGPASSGSSKDPKKAKSSSSANRKGDQATAAAKVLQEAKAAAKKTHSGASHKKGKEQANGSFPRKGKSPAEAARPTPNPSILNAPTEIDFPRGGGTSLKPIEYRQTLREARAEASAGNDAADADLFHDGNKQGKKGKGRASALNEDEERSRKKRKGDDSLAVPGSSLLKDQGIRIEHLNYKRLAPGSKLLCTVLAVHPLAIVLSLPNQLLGHVPITNISSIFTERLEKVADFDEEEDTSSDEDSDDGSDSEDGDHEGDAQKKAHYPKNSSSIPELRDMYSPGHFVIASVVSIASAGAMRGQRFGPGREGGEYERESRRIVLSLDPVIVNEGVEVENAQAQARQNVAGDLAKGYVLPVTIKAKEDNGWIVDLGLSSTSKTQISAFVPFKETPKLPGSSGHLQFPVGQVLPAAIQSVNANSSGGRILIQLSLLPEKIEKASLGATSAPSLSALMPGLLVNALITSVSNSGLGVKLWGLFDATIDRSHLPIDETKKAKEVKDQYKIGKHITARVLWDQGPVQLRKSRGGGMSLGDEDEDDNILSNGLQDNEQERKFGLSAAEHVVKLEPPISLAALLPIGTDVQATVTGCDTDWGLSVSIQPQQTADVPSLPGFVHISRISDDHITRLSPTTGSYKLESTHKARVIGHALTDRLVLLSMQESVLAQSFMRVSQVQVGEVIRATIKEVRSTGIFLNLGGSVDGVVFPLHFSDIVLKKPEKKYKPGMKVKAKVLVVEPQRNRISLTLKKTIVNSELPVVASLQDARIGIVTHATVSRVLDDNKGLLVDFFGGLRALIPASEASEAFITDLRTQFYEGKPVKVRLTHVDYESGRIVASIRQALPSFQAKLNVDAVELGQQVDAKVAAVHQDIVVLSLVQGNIRALLSLSILASHRNKSVQELRDELIEGEEINDLVVVNKNREKGIVIVGTAESSAAALGKGKKVSVGAVIEAKVIKASEPCAVTVMLPGKIRGRLHLLDCADQLEDARLPEVDSTVRCVVLALRNSSSRADVSTKQSVVAEAERGGDVAEANKSALVNVKDVRQGAKMVGFVKSIADAGLFVDIGAFVTGRVKIADLFDNFVKDWKSKFSVRQMVQVTVTEVNVDRNQVELSMKTGVKGKQVDKKGAAEQGSKKARLRDFTKGQKVNGFVRAISEYGVFVQIDDTSISGLCHKSELADTAADDALKAFSIGDRVKAKVLDIDTEKNKIAFGLKPSYFTAADFGEIAPDAAQNQQSEQGDLSEEDVGDDDRDEDADMRAVLAGSDEDDDEDDEMDDDDDSAEGDFVEADGFHQAAETNPHISRPKISTAGGPRLELSGGFSWSANDADEADSSDESDDDDGSNDEDHAPRKSSDKKGKDKKGGRVTEDVTADLATKAPESSSDFERILLGSPNSSYIWIQFMGFHVQLGDVERAREVARQALKIINFREEQERLNVWIALLNLENQYGTDDTLDKTFKEASAANDAKTIHLRMLQIFERTRKLEKAEDLWKKTTKKFGYSSKVWVLYAQFLLREGRADEARQLIPRSMQSLEKRKHVKTVTAFALSEFKVGDSERGRTVFEGLLDTYPKRLDIWLQYIDQETKQISDGKSSLAIVRGLYERVLSLKQSTKKGKAVLKKWLEFEKRKGTKEGQTAVLQRARAFVEETQKRQNGIQDETGAGSENEDEDEEDEEEE